MKLLIISLLALNVMASELDQVIKDSSIVGEIFVNESLGTLHEEQDYEFYHECVDDRAEGEEYQCDDLPRM